MSKLTRVFVAITIGFAAIAVPLLGLAAAVLYVAMISFSLFGIILVSATTLLVFKNAAIAIAVLFVGTVILALVYGKRKAVTTPEVPTVH